MTQAWQDHVSRPAGTENPRLGVRFNREGRFLPEAGNTVVAQVLPGSATESALIWLRAELQALPFGHHFAFTEVASYHMTVFEGVIETRRAPGFWPPSIPLDASIDAATEAMSRMVADLPPLPDFAMRPVAVTPFGVTLAGATGADEAAVRVWRNCLAEALGYRTPRHERYAFHTTLAYVHSWLPAEALPGYVEAITHLSSAFVDRVPVMDLARPAFCRFADMNAFPPVVPL